MARSQGEKPSMTNTSGGLGWRMPLARTAGCLGLTAHSPPVMPDPSGSDQPVHLHASPREARPPLISTSLRWRPKNSVSSFHFIFESHGWE